MILNVDEEISNKHVEGPSTTDENVQFVRYCPKLFIPSEVLVTLIY